MRIAAFFLLVLGFSSCGMPANRPVDAFVWDKLCAHEDPDTRDNAGWEKYLKMKRKFM